MGSGVIPSRGDGEESVRVSASRATAPDSSTVLRRFAATAARNDTLHHFFTTSERSEGSPVGQRLGQLYFFGGAGALTIVGKLRTLVCISLVAAAPLMALNPSKAISQYGVRS